MDLGLWGGVILYGIVPTVIYIAIGLYILSLEHIKKRPGYKLPALIYFISVPSLIVIAVTLHFGMTYMTGAFENKHGPKPAGYALYKFLVLKDVIPRSGKSLDEEKTTQTAKVTQTETTQTVKKVKFNEIDLKNKKKLNFKEHGPFYGIKENGMMIKGILKGPKGENAQTDFYGLFAKNDMFWKGYSKHTYNDGRILFQYNEYKLDENGKVIIDKDGIYQLVDTYLISEDDFAKVKKYIAYDIPIPFSFYDFDTGDTKIVENKIFENYGSIENDYGKYHGQIKDGKPHGQGTLTFNNGDYYAGEWENGDKIRKGYFVFTFDSGDKYTGDLYDGLFHGQGTYYFKNGNKYEGEFKKHQETFGTMTYVDGAIYTGQWKDDMMQGQGTIKYTDGSKYSGAFKNDMVHGQGTFISSDGKKIVGNFENGQFVEEKEVKITTVSTDEKYYALVIGNNNYEHLEKLDAAQNDAEAIAGVLQDKYGFEVELLLNGDYRTTVNSIFNMTDKLKENDNLLIYYAGHGELIKAENRGYWLPVDAMPINKSRAEWISNSTIVDRMKATKAKHVLLMVDSCFSGTLMRSGTTTEVKETMDEKYIERLKKKKTRLVITSGGNEPVVDSDGGQHSLFALKLIDILKNNNGVINSSTLFEPIRQYVSDNADQTPERAMVHKTGHDGGDFLFFPVN